MDLSRRGLLKGIIAACAAPAIIRTAGLIMPIKPPLEVPRLPIIVPTGTVSLNGIGMPQICYLVQSVEPRNSFVLIGPAPNWRMA